MSCRNLKQHSLVDTLLTEYKVLTELDDVYQLIGWNRIEVIAKDMYNNLVGKSVATVIDMQSVAIMVNLRDQS